MPTPWQQGGVTYEYVDLGLSVKWAKCNVGAETETDAGLYFAWGETTGYTASQVGTDKQFSWSDYKYGNSSSNLTKYNQSDGKTVLESADDAASQIMGGDWRMPTASEYQTLYNETLWVWCPGGNVGIKKTDEGGNESIEYIAYPPGYFVFKTNSKSDKKQMGTFTKDEKNNLIGYTATSHTVYYPGAHKVTKGGVTSIADGDTHIFFPASGYASGTGVYDRGSKGYYWSSSLHPSYSDFGRYLGFSSGFIYPQDNYYRCRGFCVRGVFE